MKRWRYPLTMQKFHDANWDFTTFDFDSAMAFADRIDDGVTRATDPNLRDFFHRGGKLL
jgi:hypothetical protein